jgi:hypothetical protein
MLDIESCLICLQEAEEKLSALLCSLPENEPQRRKVAVAIDAVWKAQISIHEVQDDGTSVGANLARP